MKSKGMIQRRIAFNRFLFEKHARHEEEYAEIGDRIAVEDLPSNHLYRWFANWMNQQLSNIGVTSRGEVELPPLHFELVSAQKHVRTAHVFQSEEFGFIVMTQPMFDEMLELSHRLVEQNPAFMTLQIAPSATLGEVAHLILLMQFSFVTSHEYSHLVRGHLKEHQPHASAVGQPLVQTQELDADGFGIYHELAFFFKRRREANCIAVAARFQGESAGKLHSVLLPSFDHDAVLCALDWEDSG